VCYALWASTPRPPGYPLAAISLRLAGSRVGLVGLAGPVVGVFELSVVAAASWKAGAMLWVLCASFGDGEVVTWPYGMSLVIFITVLFCFIFILIYRPGCLVCTPSRGRSTLRREHQLVIAGAGLDCVPVEP
jgi:hypothetical protein